MSVGDGQKFEKVENVENLNFVISLSTAVWAGNEKLICFNVKTDLTFFTKTIPYITLLVIYRVSIMNR